MDRYIPDTTSTDLVASGLVAEGQIASLQISGCQEIAGKKFLLLGNSDFEDIQKQN